MDAVKDAFRKLARAFLPVNPFAGKLRALLLFLSVFIVWTINAQNRSLPADGFIHLPAESGFIRTVLLDLAGRYFHPGTLLLTLMPIIIFTIARAQAADLLREISGADQPASKDYLDRCAFSSGKSAVSVSGSERGLSSDALHPLRVLGGPAVIHFSSAEMLVIESMRNSEYHLISLAANPAAGEYDLLYGDKFSGTLPDSACSLRLQIEYERILRQFELLVDLPTPPASTHPINSQAINKDDAWFLLDIAKGGSGIRPWLQGAIKHAIETDSSRTLNTNDHKPAVELKTIDRGKPGHNNYAQSIAPLLPGRKGFSRPRKHTLYHRDNAEVSSGDPASDPMDGSMNLIFEDMQREMVSFFNLENIHVTIHSKGNT